jgi:hypothetical protein
MASYSDDFNRADGAIGASWIEDNGDTDIYSNKAYPVGVSQWNRCRYASQLSSANQTVQADLVTKSDEVPDCGIVTRQESSTHTCYAGYYSIESNAAGYSIRKYVGGSESVLDSDISGSGVKTLAITADGATQSLSVNGSTVCTATDGAVTAGTYAGILGWSNRGYIDNWSAIDISAPTEQEGFRFRNDDGSESAATWKASQDTNINLAADTAARIRMLLNATGDPASIGAQLEYRYKPSGGAFGSWTKVN